MGLKKLRKKIRDIYDDEDDEDENGTIFAHIHMPEQEEDNSLLNSLNDDEKLLFNQKNIINNSKMQQDVGKLQALHMANTLAREIGLSNLSHKAIEANMQTAAIDPKKAQEKIIEKEVKNSLGIKGKLDEGKMIQAARGIKAIKKVGGSQATKNMDLKDIVKTGEKKLNEIEIAELILEKSGQEVKKRKSNLNKTKDNIENKQVNYNSNKMSNSGR